jgi:steroid delta-isomerase-like uncharacterized protein
MAQAEIEQVLSEYVEAKNARDVERILDLCTADCYYENVAVNGRFQGREQLRTFYEALFTSLPDYWGEFEGIAYGPGTAVTWGHFGGTLTDRLFGVPVSAGRQLRVPVTFVCSFRDGLLAGDRGFYDMATVCRQCGVALSAFGLDEHAKSAATFLAGFERLWDSREPEFVSELITEDAVMHWPGVGPIGAADYPKHIANVLDLCPDLLLTVSGHALEGELLFISWDARGTVAGRELAWSGVDRFRLRGSRAEEGLVSYDSQPIRDALAAAASAGATA